MNYKLVAQRLWGWFVVSVWIVGAPSVVYFSVLSVFKSAFSAQCVWSGRNCDAGWGAQKLVVDIPGFERDEIEEQIREPLRRR